jgi:hypothetical protein
MAELGLQQFYLDGEKESAHLGLLYWGLIFKDKGDRILNR